jgi:hypothetical protein
MISSTATSIIIKKEEKPKKSEQKLKDEILNLDPKYEKKIQKYSREKLEELYQKLLFQKGSSLLPPNNLHENSLSSAVHNDSKSGSNGTKPFYHESSEVFFSKGLSQSEMEQIFYNTLNDNNNIDKLTRLVRERNFKPRICKKFNSEMKKRFNHHFLRDGDVKLIRLIEESFEGDLKVILDIDYFNTQYILLVENSQQEDSMDKIRQIVLGNKKIWKKIFNEVMGDSDYFRKYIFLIMKKKYIDSIVKKTIEMQDKWLIQWLVSHRENGLKCTQKNEIEQNNDFRSVKEKSIFKTKNYLNHYFSEKSLFSSSKQRELQVVLQII